MPAQDIRRLRNDGFIVGYDRRRQRPAWVMYRLTPVGDFEHRQRPPFVPDPRLPDSGAETRFRGRDYDRGHLAPNYAISQLYGEQAQQQSFYYSNIVAQRPRLNQLVWQRFEEIEIDDIVPRVGRLWVIVGPVGADAQGRARAFFRIWFARRDSQWQALAFHVPQTVRGDERLADFITSIDAIEQATGLDFMSGLDRAAQRRLEQASAPAATFGFAAFACQPARYGKRWQNRDGIVLRYDRCTVK